MDSSVKQILDSFEYSSRKINKLFNLIGWGNKVLALIADSDSEKYNGRSVFFKTYPFFDSSIPPKGNAYLITHIIYKKGAEVLKKPDFNETFMA